MDKHYETERSITPRIIGQRQDGPLDFCILGAPKSGKTALVAYLRTHPQVFITDVEPNFYANDIPEYGPTPRPKTRQAYCEFYAAAAEGQLVGEVSGLYLLSERAIPNLLRDSPHARFIVFLRNPVHIAHALHARHLRSLDEDESSFQKAWDLQDARAAGQRIPRLCTWPKNLIYRERCFVASKLERFFQRVPRERVLVHVYEEFFADLKANYLRTLAFLGLPDDGRRDFPRINEHAALRSRSLQRLALRPPPLFNRLYRPLKRAFNAFGLQPRLAFYRWNESKEQDTSIDPSFRRRLEAEFQPDIARLETILGRDLDVWRSD